MSETEKEQKFGLFDYFNDIGYIKSGLADQDPEFEENYPMFMISRGCSFQVDAVLWANALNEYHESLTKRMHHDFLMGVLSKKKRYGKWFKAAASEEKIDAVCDFYSVNRDEAEKIVALLTEDRMDEILARNGGKEKRKSKSKKSD